MLEALGNIGDFVGGLAIIATLVHLALQVRQNSQLLRRAALEPAGSATTLTHFLPPELPSTLQERAVTSPVWYTPPGA